MVDKNENPKKHIIWPFNSPNIVGPRGWLNFLLGCFAYSTFGAAENSEQALSKLAVCVVLMALGLPVVLYASLLKRIQALESPGR